MRRCTNCFSDIDDELEMCPFCGYYTGIPIENGVALRPGTRIANRYTVGKVIGSGGFGFTYLAWDDTLQQRVAIREYLPTEFSTRSPNTSSVSVFQGEKSEQFSQGLDKFIEESRKLAKFQNEEGIVKTFDCISENGTAYIIMEYLEGQTLAEYLQKNRVIPQDDAVRMLTPIMESLVSVHEVGILHRDIAPENIFICNDGSAKLIDFSASRFASATHSRSLTVMVKPGFSPEEQYRSMGEQGPHSDVYSVAATLYKMVTGITPPDALERRAKVENSKKDMLVEPGKINKNVSRVFENAVMNALNVQISDRTKDMQQFINDLHAEAPVKRVYGKIHRIDMYRWPLWAKVLIPSLASVLVLFVVLYLTGVISFSNMFHKETNIPEGYVVVPKVVGMDANEASTVMEKENVTYMIIGSTKSEYVPVNMIVDQDPRAGTYVLMNTTINVVISKGEGEVKAAVNGITTVPYVLFADKEAAKRDLSTAGLSYALLEEYCDTVQANGIVRMTLENGNEVQPGDQLTEGTIVYLYVSKGPEGFQMPDLTGLSEAEAKQKIAELGMVVTDVISGETSLAEMGKVYEQSIAPGTTVYKGSEISITVAATPASTSLSSETSATKTPEPTKRPSKPTSTNTPAPTKSPAKTPAPTKIPSNTPTSVPVPTKTPANAPTPTTAPQTVPSVVGMVKSDAMTALQSRGLKVEVLETSDESVDAGYVIKQNPTAGTDTKSVTTVSITVSTGKKNIIVHLNTDGADSSYDDITVHLNDPYGSLPTPTKSYYSFNGWYTSADGGSKVTADSIVAVSDTHTLYAQWTQNPVSDWVLASNVPSDAQIVETKYTYTLTEYTSSSASSLSGWGSPYDKQRTSWGATQGPVYSDPSSGNRNVWSERYEISRTHHFKYYHRYGKGKDVNTGETRWLCGSDSSLKSGTRHEIDLTSSLTKWDERPRYKTYKCPQCGNAYDWYYDGEYDDIQYGTRWYYQEPVYTYYFSRNVSKESSSDPTGQSNVSNVKKYVKYKEK